MPHPIDSNYGRGSAEPPSLALGTSRRVHTAQRKLQQTLGGFIALGAVLTAINSRWPLARNALNYAKAAVAILERHFDLLAVTRDWNSTGGKPILFSVLSSPFVWMTNAITGTLVASALGTAFFLFATFMALPRLNARAGLDPGVAPLELAFVAFNPLVLYQFWSGYPDSLFAGFVILAFVLIDVISNEPERDTRWHIVGLGVTICAAILTKLYGTLLALLCPLYLLIHVRQFLTRAAHRRSKILAFSVTLLGIVLMLITAKLKLNPLLDFGVGAGSNGYVVSVTTIKDAALMLAFCVLLTFHIALIFIFMPGAWGQLSVAEAVFVSIYILGLLPFSGSAYNMRYFLPAFPFISVMLVGGSRSLPWRASRVLIFAYMVLAAILVSNFNVAVVQQAFHPLTSRLYSWQPNLADWLDNLRLPVQVELKKQIDTINFNVPQGGTLYWASDYYGALTHGFAHHLGVRKDIDVRYVLEPADIPDRHGSVFLTLFSSLMPPEEFWPTPQWATVKSLRHGVFRLDPLVLRIRSTGGDSLAAGEPVKLRVDINSEILLHDLEVVEDDDSRSISSERSAEVVLPSPVPGRHEYIARARYDENEVAISKPIVVYVGVPALERRAILPGDLMVEFSDGSPLVPKDVLVLDEVDRAVGVRFDDVQVPQGAHISEVYLAFTAASVASGPTTLSIHAELSTNADTMGSRMDTVTSRVPTQAAATWRLGQWKNIDDRQTSPNLAPLLEEITGQSRWVPGNPIVFIIRVAGQTRTVNVADVRKAPSLYVKMR